MISPKEILEKTFEVIAALESKAVEDGLDIINSMAGSSVFELLSKDQKTAMSSTLEVIAFVLTNSPGGRVDLCSILNSDVIDVYPTTVKTNLNEIIQKINPATPRGAANLKWSSLRETVQRARSYQQASALLTAIEEKRSATELVEVHSKIEPPTTVARISAKKPFKTAYDLGLETLVDSSVLHRMRLSSGFPGLDHALTGTTDKETGFISLGENVIIVAPSGTGKSAFSYSISVAMAKSMVNHGLDDAFGIFAHTEESSYVKMQAAGLNPGQRYHNLAKNIIIENVNASRKRLVTLCYDVVERAHEKSASSGRPITDFLPYFFILDYIQSITEAGEDKNTATDRTSELLIRGIQEWDPESMKLYGGVSYQEYTGNQWPTGMEGHKVATVGFAQIRKGSNDKNNSYAPGMDLTDFTLEDRSDNPPWRPEGSSEGYQWKVEVGDMKMYKSNDIAYAATIQNNATNILFLHRSRPKNGKKVRAADGSLHLEETNMRARIIFEKTRNSAGLAFVPMVFDSDSSGFRGRWYDPLAPVLAELGEYEFDDVYETWEDIMVPKPIYSSALDKIHY